MQKKISFEILERVYQQYNKRELVHPDPLEFLFAYKNIQDREIVGLVASSLAYGRVAQILKSVNIVLMPMEGSPADFILSHSKNDFEKIYSGFKHRFTTSEDLVNFLCGIKFVVSEYGSLENCMAMGLDPADETLSEALNLFVEKLKLPAKIKTSSLLPNPSLSSACKRLYLFLRWMIRSDEVDPGGWHGISAAKLIVPLDTHMFHFGTFYGFTSRKSADAAAAKEITAGFKSLCPDDPVKYDFALTRFGIRNDLNWGMLDELLT